MLSMTNSKRPDERNSSESNDESDFESDESDEDEVELWRWNDDGFKKCGLKAPYKKRFYREIIRGDELIRLGDCAVFISTDRSSLPFVGRIDSLWETGSGNMIVKVRWFYHPEETKAPPNLCDQKVFFSIKDF